MAWESHLSARTGFSSSLIGSEVPAEMERVEVVRCLVDPPLERSRRT